MVTLSPKVVVLRHPQQQGNFIFQMAELPSSEIDRWQEAIRGGKLPEVGDMFGQPLTLNQVMAKLKTRDFQVIDYPAALKN